MILQMLVVGVAVGLGAAGLQIPKYAQYAASLSKAAEALTINVMYVVLLLIIFLFFFYTFPQIFYTQAAEQEDLGPISESGKV